mmetsp:Transcript_74020/g.163474  ORF Transcript_74020/g.163474 Transcript_74020/m.163474 type:complete len:244 (+) Transcript_74020:76-807(+)
MPQSHVESKACSEAHVSEGAGQDMAWAPKLGSKAKEVNGEQAEDASTDGTAHEASSPLSARPFPTLADLRSQVDQQLQEACAMRSSWEVSTENSRLSHDLRAARSQLEEGEIEAAWQEEVEFWKEEVSRLEAEVLALRQRRAEAEAKAQLKVGKESTVVALSGAEQQLAELESEQASCEAACEKAERQNAKLRHSLKQNSSLERGGAARLFVSALPALDAAAVEAARTALHAHMQKKLSGPKS